MLRYFTSLLFISTLACASSNEVPESLLKQQNTVSNFLSTELISNIQGQDVHQFNRKLASYAEIVREANKAFGFTSTLSSKDILNKLSQYREAYNFDKDFEKEIGKLRAYLASGQDKDTETGMYASEVLEGVWGYLVKRKMNEQQIALSEVFFYLKQNTKENGGCFPGYVGRLMLTNLIFIVREINRSA